MRFVVRNLIANKNEQSHCKAPLRARIDPVDDSSKKLETWSRLVHLQVIFLLVVMCMFPLG